MNTDLHNDMLENGSVVLGSRVEVGFIPPETQPSRSRKARRYERRSPLRAKTIALKRLTKEEIRLGRDLFAGTEVPRPQTRSDCQGGPRPCPFVSCRHHLYLDVNPETGSIKPLWTRPSPTSMTYGTRSVHVNSHRPWLW